MSETTGDVARHPVAAGGAGSSDANASSANATGTPAGNAGVGPDSTTGSLTTDTSSQRAASGMQGAHSYLTSITTIKPERLPQLQAVLAQFADPERASPIAVIGTIHFARWVIIDNGTRLLFTSNFDGTLDDYLNDFIEKASAGMDAIWGNCEGYPAGGARDVEAFKTYVRQSEIPNTLVYSAYPDATVRQVTQALRTRQKFEDFLDEFQG